MGRCNQLLALPHFFIFPSLLETPNFAAPSCLVPSIGPRLGVVCHGVAKDGCPSLLRAGGAAGRAEHAGAGVSGSKSRGTQQSRVPGLIWLCASEVTLAGVLSFSFCIDDAGIIMPPLGLWQRLNEMACLSYGKYRVPSLVPPLK